MIIYHIIYGKNDKCNGGNYRETATETPQTQGSIGVLRNLDNYLRNNGPDNSLSDWQPLRKYFRFIGRAVFRLHFWTNIQPVEKLARAV